MQQADFSLIYHHACEIHNSLCLLLRTNPLHCDGCAKFEYRLHSRTNVFVSSEGSERLHKEDASDEDEDTEYFDAMEDSPAFITVTATESTQHR